MKNTRLLITASLFAALIFVATFLLNIKLPYGYANLGDSFIIAASFVLSHKYGVCAAAIGSSLSDVCLGYVHYAPATFVIKGLMALFCTAYFKKHSTNCGVLIAALISEVIMVAGYFLYEILLYGVGGAIVTLSGNSIQGILNVIAAYALIFILRRYLPKYLKLENK